MKLIQKSKGFFTTHVVIETDTQRISFDMYDQNKADLWNKRVIGIMETIILLLVLVSMVLGFVAVSSKQPSGHYAPDYINESGEVIDIDGDGLLYHWVED